MFFVHVDVVFFKQKTAYELRISDWSSDVCSSDLYQNAISFLERHPAVDPDKNGAWGISYSGGNVLILAAIDERVKTAISHVPVIDGYATMRSIHGVTRWRQLLKLIDDDRALSYDKPGEQLHLLQATIAYVNEIHFWTVPEAEIIF